MLSTTTTTTRAPHVTAMQMSAVDNCRFISDRAEMLCMAHDTVSSLVVAAASTAAPLEELTLVSQRTPVNCSLYLVFFLK